jgi:hypothetical protein
MEISSNAMNAKLGSLKGLRDGLNSRIDTGEITTLGQVRDFVNMWVETTEQIVQEVLGDMPSPILRPREGGPITPHQGVVRYPGEHILEWSGFPK